MFSNKTFILPEARGRTDKPCSSLDAPKYAPYKDGRGTLDVGMKPIEKEEVFQVDRFWPYYMSRKHWLLAHRRNMFWFEMLKIFKFDLENE